MSYSTTVIIEEIDSTTGSVRQRVYLSGGGLPFMGAEWGAEYEMETTWYPGNPEEATQQLLVPKELPSQWQGDWRRTIMNRTPCSITDVDGNTQQVVDPTVLRDFLEGIWRGGRRLRVTWQSEQLAETMTEWGVGSPFSQSTPFSSKIVREGRAKTWKFKHRSMWDIEWDVTFEWVSRGATTPRIAQVRTDSVQGLSAKYLAQIAALKAANAKANAAQFAPVSLTLGQLESLASAPTAAMNSIVQQATRFETTATQIVALAASPVQQSINIARLAINLGTNTVAICNQTYEQMSAIPAEVQSLKADASDVLQAYRSFGQVQDTVRMTARAGQVYGDGIRASVATQAAALQGVQANSQSAGPDTVMTAVVVKTGDTPQKLSQRYYGSPDNAVDILRANRLPWHVSILTPGTILIIPVLSSTATATTV